MKFATCFCYVYMERSHPTRGAWIEMVVDPRSAGTDAVAPHTGCVD